MRATLPNAPCLCRNPGRCVYAAFVIGAFALCIVGWRVGNSLRATLVLDALEQWVGSVDDACDNAAESIVGLHRTELIRPRGPWRGLGPVEFSALEWVDSFDHWRLLEVIGNRPSAVAEAAYRRQREPTAWAA
ncbi:MAG: hypothetical protein OXG98_06290 [Gemmatimonadetes bacterium]|nr:hypothetical protein [Gemmatimonadota bacterium]